ncbi:MAG: hypothetical protein RLZ04_1644 [Actinomycetota bacterium]
MSRSTRVPALRALVALGLVASVLGAPQIVRADEVDQAKARVEQVVSQLQTLRDQLGQIDEDYSQALDRKDQLDADIVIAEQKVAEMASQLGGVEDMLTDIALRKFTGGGSTALSPLFSNAAAYSLAEQKESLSRVALDAGATEVDDLTALVDAYTREQANLQSMQAEVSTLITTLDQKKVDYAALETQYTELYAQAQQELDAAELQAAEDAYLARISANQQSWLTAGNGGTGSSGGSSTPSRGGGSSSSSGGSTATPPPVSGRAGVAVSAAYSQLGVPYRFAAEQPGVAFDCSGLTKWVWGQAGVYLPHQSRQQYNVLPHISPSQVQPGDLLFYKSPIGHVSIYVGGGQMIHATQPGDVVKLATVGWDKVVGIARPG